MKNTIKLLILGFESSSGLTEQFKKFYTTFKREFKKELLTIGATDIVFSRGHFYVSGFYTVGVSRYYFSLPDVRGMEYGLKNNPDSCMNKLMYRTVKDYRDYTGGMNKYARIEHGMADNMFSFKLI